MNGPDKIITQKRPGGNTPWLGWNLEQAVSAFVEAFVKKPSSPPAFQPSPSGGSGGPPDRYLDFFNGPIPLQAFKRPEANDKETRS